MTQENSKPAKIITAHGQVITILYSSRRNRQGLQSRNAPERPAKVVGGRDEGGDVAIPAGAAEGVSESWVKPAELETGVWGWRNAKLGRRQGVLR